MMAKEEANGTATLGENTSEMAELTGSAVLVVIGEPFTAEHKELILERITKGFRGWNVEATGCDINAELTALANSAPTGEDGPNGEVVIQYTSPVINVTVLVNPQCTTVVNHLRQLLISGGKHRTLIFAGHTIQGSGEWLLQDECFTYEKFAEIAKSTDVENALKQQEGGSLDVNVFDEGHWKQASMAKQSFAKLLNIQVNPDEKLTDINGVLQFSAYLTFFVKVRSTKELLKASDVVGNIRFSRPTLYIFPGAQGDSALFGISGFNLLVNGGYSRKSCFWDFTRHLDRIDAVLNTHLGADNFMGLGCVLDRKATDNVHPELGYMYMNAVEKTKHSPNGDIQPEEGGNYKPASLLVNLVEEGNKMVNHIKQLGQSPSPCVGRVVGNVLEPITLYHKVGHGTLDMFVLNPVQDSKDLKDFLAQWNKDVNSFSMVKSGLRGGNIPLPNMVSICALLVWRPSVSSEKITRILFPGSAPQNKIFEGLDKLKSMDIFQHDTCSEKSLHAPKGTCKKGAGGAPKPSKAAVGKPAPIGRSEPPKKQAEKKPLKKVEKGTKEETNKKALEKKEKKSPSSSKSTTPASITPSQSASEVSSPQEKAQSPVEPPKEALPEKKEPPAPVEVVTPEAAPEVDVPPPTEADAQAEQAAKPEADQIPSPVPDPVPEPVVAALERSSPEPKLQEEEPKVEEPALIESPVEVEKSPPVQSAPEEPAPVEPTPAEPSLVEPSPAESAPQEPESIEPEPELIQPSKEEVVAEEVPVVDAVPVDAAAAEPLISMDDFTADKAPLVPEPVAIDPPMPPTDPCLAAPVLEVREVGADILSAEAAEPVEAVSPSASQEDKQSLEDLGIYDDEKDVDTAEVTASAASQASSQADDQGLGDEEAEGVLSPSSEPLVDFGVADKVEAEQAPTVDAAPAADVSPVPKQVTEADMAASQQPEADQMVFGGAAPEGLPEPADPVLEPEMSLEQDFLDQMQQGPKGVKDADMPPVPEPEMVEALTKEEPPKSPEPQAEAVREVPTQASPEAPAESEIELAEEPHPEDEQMFEHRKEELPESIEPQPVQPEAEVELATEPPVDASREPELEIAVEPDMELPEEDRHLSPEQLEPEVELAQKAELMQAEQEPEVPQDQPLELATKADETVSPAPERDMELAEEASQPLECQADLMQSEPEALVAPDAGREMELAEEASQPLECQACDDRKIFPDEPVTDMAQSLHADLESNTSPLPVEEAEEAAEQALKSRESASPVDDLDLDTSKSSPDSQSPVVEEAREADEATDLECRACDERKLFPDEPPSVETPSLQGLQESTSPCLDSLPSPVEAEPKAISPSASPQPPVEESVVETHQVPSEQPQVALLEDLPSPSDPSLSEHLTATDHDEDSSACDKDHDGDDDSLLHQHSAMETSMEGSFHASTNPFDIVDGPTRTTDPMSMSFFDDGSETTNPFLGIEGGSNLQSDVSSGIPHDTDNFGQDQNQNPFDLPTGTAPVPAAATTTTTTTTASSVAPNVQALQQEGIDRDSLEREDDTFDPLKAWGQPMGLPAPAPPAEKNEKPSPRKEGASKKPGSAGATRKVDPSKKGPSATPRPGAKKADPGAKSAAPKPGTPKKEAPKKEAPKRETPKKEPPKPKNGPSATSKLKNGTKETKNVNAAPKPAPAKREPLKTAKKPTTRPATAPAKSETAKSETMKRESPRPTPTTKRPATSGKSSTAKAPTPTPVVPFYVDLTYVPCHGDMHYVDLDFFRRIRARYYVISALNPSPGVLNALLEAKQTWENPETEVTLIPTYDTETLRHWMGLHRDQLSQLKIDVAPSASRCTIQLQDHETSCAAYRLEF